LDKELIANKTLSKYFKQVLSFVPLVQCPYYTNRHQGWSKLRSAFAELTSKFCYLSQSGKIWS